MDYAPNGSLRKCHPKGTLLPLTTILSYVKPIASALQYAHNAKTVHRDVKPENMLRGLRNEALLSDFGIATVSHSYNPSSSGMAGTIPYMAPEQIQGKPRSASDQYALGIVVYEWLSGDYPFHGSFSEIASQHILVPPPLREKLPTILPAIEEVVLKALAKQPEDRFESVQAFATALENACQLPGEEYYPEHVSRAIWECYYQSSKVMSRLGAPMEVSQSDGQSISSKSTSGYKRPFMYGSIYWRINSISTCLERI